MIARLGRVAVSVLVGVATALVIVAVSIVPFLTPQWVAFEQDRSNAGGLTGYGPAQLRTATDSILHDLVLGPPSFDVAVAGQPVLGDRERAHMRDVRNVFTRLYGAAGASLALLAIVALPRRRSPFWAAMRRGSLVLAGGVAVLGVVVTLAFDQAFTIFHDVFFAAGTWEFDPRTSRLVQLFPDRFWSETTIVVGAVVLIVSLGVASAAGRRLAAARLRESRSGRDAGRAALPEPAG